VSRIPPPRPDDPGTAQDGTTLDPSTPSPTSAQKHDLAKIRYQADVDLARAEAAADRELEKIEATSDFSLNQAFHQGLMDVEKGSIDRATAGAESVRNAAAAIGVIYTGILGLAFSVGDRPLPARGTIPAFFLGLSIVLATAYMAYLTDPPEETEWPQGGRSVPLNQSERTSAFIRWIGDKVRNRAYVLRTAVTALGFGVAFLPVGFVSLGTTPSPLVSEAQGTEVSIASWPSPPPDIDDPALQQVLYEAQVAEAKEQRAIAQQTTPSESWSNIRVRVVYIAAAASIFLVFLIPLLVGKLSKPGRPSDE
jgi:hypothetical protein